jgi:hypothetical protein
VTPPLVLPDGFAARAAWTADLSGDGNADLIVDSISSFNGPCNFVCTYNSSQHVSVFLGKGDGTFNGEQIFATGIYQSADGGTVTNTLVSYDGAADFNGDGNLDIAATTAHIRIAAQYPPFAISLGNGNGTFGSPIGLPDPGRVSGTEDLNGDGLADLIVLDATNNSIDVLLNATPAFSMTTSANTLTATAGQQITDTFSFTGVNGFSSTVQLSCQVVGLAPAPTCSLSPASITAGASSSTSTLSVSVPGASAGLVSPRSRWALQPLYALAFPFAFVGLGFRRKRVDPRYKLWLLTACLATAALLSTGCGGGSSNTQSVHQPQSYTVQVTAASDSLTKAMQIPLTVQ